MNVYFDTEFSSLWDPQPLSVGLAADNGTTFYVELEHDASRNSDFTRRVVVPLLEGNPVSREVAEGRLYEYLATMIEEPGPLQMVCDFIGDWWILREIAPGLADYVTPRCGNGQGRMTSQRAFSMLGKPPHNALTDAMVLRMVRPALQEGT